MAGGLGACGTQSVSARTSARRPAIAGSRASAAAIAVGYLFAHYFAWLLVDGQRIVIAISDPLQQGANYLGTAFFETTADFLPPGLVWTLQLAAVVGGHMIGAWAGHVVAASQAGLTTHDGQYGHYGAEPMRAHLAALKALAAALEEAAVGSLDEEIDRTALPNEARAPLPI